MNKKEKEKWKKALLKTKKKYENAVLNSLGTCFIDPVTKNAVEDIRLCPLCGLSRVYTSNVCSSFCHYCIVPKSRVYENYVYDDDEDEIDDYSFCGYILESAHDQRRKRPIFRAIDRMLKWLDKN